MLDGVVYWLFRLTIVVTRPLPLRLGYRVAGSVSAVCYRTIFRGHRKALMANLARVLDSDGANGAEASSLRRLDEVGERSFRNFGKYVIDFIHFPSLTRDEMQRRLRFEQWDELNAAADSGRGIIIATLHFGNWDLGAAALAAYGYKINAVAETFPYPPMNDLVQGSRAKLGLRFIGSERTGPTVFRALRRGEMLAILVDVVTDQGSTTVDFFGAPAKVSAAAARVALRTNAWVIPAIVARDPNDDMAIAPVLDFSLRDFTPAGDEAADARELTQRIMASMEPHVRAHPDQWFMYRRMWSDAGELTGGGARPSAAGLAN